MKNLNFLDWDDIYVIAHYDTDGLCSCAQMIKILEHLGKSYKVFVFEQLTKNILEEIPNDANLIFLDFGSNHISLIENKFKNFLIIDHHPPEKYHKNVINTRYYNYGDYEACTSSIMFLISKKFEINTSRISLIGVLGDVQKKDGNLHGINKIPLNYLPEYIEKTYDLTFFGYFLKNIYNFLISNTRINPENIKKFIYSIGIDENYKYGYLENNLKKEIIKFVIKNSNKKQENLGYMFIDWYEDITLEEIATLINSCGRNNNWKIGLKYLTERKGLDLIKLEYKKYCENIKNVLSNLDLKENGKFCWFEIKNPSIVGVVCGMISNNKPLVIGFADYGEYFKVSARSKLDINLGEIMKKICFELGGEGGGHKNAAGGFVPKHKQDEFLKRINYYLSNSL